MRTEEKLLEALKNDKIIIEDTNNLKCPLCLTGCMKETGKSDCSKQNTILCNTMVNEICSVTDTNQLQTITEGSDSDNNLILLDKSAWKNGFSSVDIFNTDEDNSHNSTENDNEVRCSLAIDRDNNGELFECQFCNFKTVNLKHATLHNQSCLSRATGAFDNHKHSSQKW